MLKQFKSTSLADQVFDRLENDIIQGVYPKGEILTELKLVEQLGVSRTPIREALRRLEQERLIEDAGKGCRHEYKREGRRNNSQIVCCMIGYMAFQFINANYGGSQ